MVFYSSFNISHHHDKVERIADVGHFYWPYFKRFASFSLFLFPPFSTRRRVSYLHRKLNSPIIFPATVAPCCAYSIKSSSICSQRNFTAEFFKFNLLASIFYLFVGVGREYNMASQSGASRRSISSVRKSIDHGVSQSNARKSLSSSRPMGLALERTVKSLRLSKALTVPETTTIYEACRRMAARRVDAILVTDSSALLCGILTDKDITKRAIAPELSLEDTPVSKIMTKNPVFVLSETLAVEALQKMVQGWLSV
ncbi:hypothetical protein PIB30_015816 [Stylosanthes scabra]|uniref:CBS domain-containing protein n=1 Tax=Stylosanthes scabra TaxID=79078 RepID=A0ABU6Q752_9FABA|nr:hypothetical protein [Stylosanthes scabra]